VLKSGLGLASVVQSFSSPVAVWLIGYRETLSFTQFLILVNVDQRYTAITDLISRAYIWHPI